MPEKNRGAGPFDSVKGHWFRLTLNRAVTFYFLLSYFLSWCVFVPLALQAQGLLSGLPAWFHLLGAYGPLLAALITALAFEGLDGARRLLAQLTRWRIGWGWWLVALGSPLLLFAAAVLLSNLFGSPAGWNAFGRVDELPGLAGLAGWAVWLLTFGLGEETGWRGFALPHLQRRYSARTATLILGFLWAGWHAPTFFYNYELSAFSVLAFTVSILSGALLLTWLYNSTGGSVLATLVWHGTFNAATAGAEGLVAPIATAAVILAVILIGRRYGAESLSHREKYTGA